MKKIPILIATLLNQKVRSSGGAEIFEDRAFGKSLRKLAALLSVAFLVLFVLCPGGRAQEMGRIAGTVTDSTGAAVPNVVVTARNIGTNAVRTVTTNSTGSYIFTGLTPAMYDLTTAASGGFSAYKTQVEVTVGGRLTVDIKVAVGATTATVEVSAAEGGAQVNTQTQELSQVVGPQQVAQMPSLTRNPYDFVTLSGNVSNGDANGGNSTGNGHSQNSTSRGVGFSINGQRASGTEILLDGVENVSVFGDSVGILIPIDATQEFRVITSNFEPQYGRASGGIVSVTTKTGTNAFHGSVWEFNRVGAYTSNTVTNAQEGNPKGQYTRNQFGFAVGGPVLRDKLFFFGSTEWTRVRSAASLTGAVPTPEFLALADPKIQSFFSAYGGGGSSFKFISTTDNATIAANNNGVPIANVPLNTPVFGTVAYKAPADAGGGLPQNTYNIVGRVDYNLGSRTQSFFRYVDYNEVDGIGSQFASPYSQYNVGQSEKNQAYLLSVIHEFSPSISTITKASFSRFDQTFSYDTKLQNVPTLFVSTLANIPGTGTPIQLPGFYDTNPANGGLPFGGPQNDVQINQDLGIIKGRHSMGFGGQILYIQSNNAYGAYAQANEQLGTNRAAGLQALQNGNLFQFTAAVSSGGALPCIRNPYTNALTQTPACSITLPATSPSFARSNRFHDWAVYAQDNWKATPRLSINYGVRYEYYGVQHNNKAALESNFFYGPGSSIPQQMRSGQILTTPNSPVGGLWKPQYGTVSPRVGFAYDIFGNGRTSIRGGYGISYERNFGNVTFNVIQNPPGTAVVNIQNTVVTNSNSGPLAGSSGSVPLPPTSVRHVDQNIRTSQTQFFSASLDQQLAPNTVVSLQYTGSRGLHLYDIKNYNALGSGTVLLGDPILDPGGSGKKALTRLNPQYGNINNRGSNGDSYYHAMNVQFQSTNLHRTGLSLVANYTFGHQTDDLSTTFSESNGGFGLGYTQPFNPGFDHGSGDLDIRQRLVIAPIYRTPSFGTTRHGILNEALGGWQVTGIYTVRTGTPFTYFDSTNNITGYQVSRYAPLADGPRQHTFKSIPKGASSGGVNSYVIGTLPAANTYFNAALPGEPSDWGPYPANMTARNAFRGPGAWQFDASVSKTFPIREQINLEFRAEGFDILNHHNLYIQGSQNDVANGSSAPAILASKGGVSTINSGGVGDERRFGQFALKINF